jgi:hypothetical protein
MRRALTGTVVAIALLAPTTAGSASVTQDDPESCWAMNPAQPKCSFTVTSTSTSGAITGAVGAGDWIVIVKRGKKKLSIKPSGPEPEPIAFAYQEGDKVKATAKSAGAWVLAGHD